MTVDETTLYYLAGALHGMGTKREVGRFDGFSLRKSGKDQVIRYQPLSNFVLIERIDDALDKSAGGIVIPEIGQVKSNKGRVRAIGEGYVVGDKLVPIPLQEGDVVLFSKYGGEEVKLEGTDYILLRYDEVKLKERIVVA